MGWHGLACLCALVAADDVLELFEGETATADVDEGAYNGANHVAKETIGGNLEVPAARLVLYPTGNTYVANGGFIVGTSLAEGCEIGDGGEVFACAIHFVEIQVVVSLERVSAVEWRLARVYIIMVRARNGAKTCMHIVGNRLYAVDGDIGWQNAVEPERKLLTVDVEQGVEMCCHPSGMYASIGSAGTYDGRLLA